MCGDCYNANRPTKIQWPTDEVLAEMLRQESYTAVSKIIGVSDNAIRKRLASRNVVIINKWSHGKGV